MVVWNPSEFFSGASGDPSGCLGLCLAGWGPTVEFGDLDPTVEIGALYMLTISLVQCVDGL